ncbi:DEAD/DEAH box helicase [Mycobacterium ulcerans]|nr:DEAD/DEAH box helicase [Mycobacterium ulcerans]
MALAGSYLAPMAVVYVSRPVPAPHGFHGIYTARGHDTEMYLRGGLRRTGDAVSSLWIHQGDVLRAYAQKHQDTADIALELPTGTGKTLPGLLIAEWVRRKAAGPVLYATPTKQLARQVLATAHAEGVPARLLVGSHLHWNVTDHSDVDGGEAIAITTYSSIFNSSPKLPVPNLIVFDDAHAGEQFVGEHYSVEIRRYEDEPAYLAVLDALRPFMSGLQIQRLQGVPDPGAHHQVRLILPAVKPGAPARLDTPLSNLGDSYKFDFAMIWYHASTKPSPFCGNPSNRRLVLPPFSWIIFIIHEKALGIDRSPGEPRPLAAWATTRRDASQARG